MLRKFQGRIQFIQTQGWDVRCVLILPSSQKVTMAVKVFLSNSKQTEQHCIQEWVAFLNMGIWEWDFIGPFVGLRLQNFLPVITGEIGFCLSGQTSSVLRLSLRLFFLWLWMLRSYRYLLQTSGQEDFLLSYSNHICSLSYTCKLRFWGKQITVTDVLFFFKQFYPWGKKATTFSSFICYLANATQIH